MVTRLGSLLLHATETAACPHDLACGWWLTLPQVGSAKRGAGAEGSRALEKETQLEWLEWLEFGLQ